MVVQAVQASVPAARLDKVRRGAGGSISARRGDLARGQVHSRAGCWPRDFWKSGRRQGKQQYTSWLGKNLEARGNSGSQKRRELPLLF